MQQKFFTPDHPSTFADNNRGRGPFQDEEKKETQKNYTSQNVVGSPSNRERLDLQSQIHLSTEKIDPKSLSPLHIYLSVSGMIESGECGAEEFLQVKFDLLQGRDWKLLAVCLGFFWEMKSF